MSNETYRPISGLSLWEANYNHGDVEGIAKSIRRFGFNNAFRVWNGIVVAGNHSLKALRLVQASGETPPANIEVRKGEWFAPCVEVSHLTKEGAEAFAVADNRLASLATQDEGKLAELLQSAKTCGMLDQTGYSDKDLTGLLKKAGKTESNQSIGSGGSQSASPIQAMKWAKNEVPLTSEEIEELNMRLESWKAESGTAFGFVRHILEL